MRRLVEQLRTCLAWLVLADIYPNRDHRRHGWQPAHTTRKDHR